MSKGSDAGASPMVGSAHVAAGEKPVPAANSDAEKAARAWLDAFCRDSENENARCIKALLAEPRLPAEPTPEALGAMMRAYHATSLTAQGTGMSAAYRALYAELTAPKTKTVEVWRVEYSCREFDVLEFTPRTSTYPNTPEGIRARDGWIESFKNDARVACIHVTGPHKQEVPND